MSVPLIHDIHFNRSRQHDLDPKFEVYLILKQETCYDYRRQPNYRQLYAEGKSSLENLPTERLWRGLHLKDGPMLFELCIRWVDDTT